MFIVIVHHWCKEGMLGVARDRIDRNGDAMAGVPGFQFRYRLEDPSSPLKVSTVTAWLNEADYKEWLSRKNQGMATEAESPYEQVENSVYVVARAHGAPT